MEPAFVNKLAAKEMWEDIERDGSFPQPTLENTGIKLKT
jgi:hypothetical protein